jgi:hypothetical protein
MSSEQKVIKPSLQKMSTGCIRYACKALDSSKNVDFFAEGPYEPRFEGLSSPLLSSLLSSLLGEVAIDSSKQTFTLSFYAKAYVTLLFFLNSNRFSPLCCSLKLAFMLVFANAARMELKPPLYIPLSLLFLSHSLLSLLYISFSRNISSLSLLLQTRRFSDIKANFVEYSADSQKGVYKVVLDAAKPFCMQDHQRVLGFYFDGDDKTKVAEHYASYKEVKEKEITLVQALPEGVVKQLQ